MSKEKDFEYSGRLDSQKQKGDSGYNKDSAPNYKEQRAPNNMDSKDLHDNSSNNDLSPNIQQTNDDLVDRNNHYPPQNERVKPSQDDIEPQETNEDMDDGNSSDTDGNKGQDDNGEITSDDEYGHDHDEGSDETTSDDDHDETSGDSSAKDDDITEDTEESASAPEQTSDSDEDNAPKQEPDEPDSDDNSLKGQILGKIDPDLQKASKLKDLSKMNKEQAKQELIEISKSFAKKKAAAVVATYLSPIILPILGVILAVLLVLFTIIGASNMMNDNENEKDKEGCSAQDVASTNVKDSKDAKKNAESIYKYAKENVKGSTRKGIAAWLGNIKVESGGTFSSSTIQGGNDYKESLAKDPNANGYAFGFAQLDGGRRVNLIKYADKKGKKWSDMDVQLDFILNHDSTDSDLIKKLLKKDGDIKSITADIMNDWERAGAKDSLPERQAAASKYYTMFGEEGDSNISESTASAGDNSDAGSNSGCNGDSDSKVDGQLGASTKANGKSGEVIKVWNSKKEIPDKYKKHIELPDYKGEKLNSSENVFPITGNKGQCTEYTFSYMSQLYKGQQPTNGNGNVIYKAYKAKGAKTTSNPTVGYGFSSDPPYAGAMDASVGHTGVVIGVMQDGKWLMGNYNLRGEANKDESRVETFALVDGNKKSGGTTFFSGIGEPKIKSK